MTTKSTWRYWAAFAALIMLCGTSHEFAHHFAGVALCGSFGHKTFNSFHLAPGCAKNLAAVYVSELAGPLLTFGLMWMGLFMMRPGTAATQSTGFALVFANFPVNRMFFVLIGANDEQYANGRVFGRSTWLSLITILAVWLLCVPPLLAAYRHLRGRHRTLRFAAWFFLPFVFVIVFAGFLEEVVLLRWKIGAQEVFGIPYLILAVEILSLAVYYRFRGSLADVD